MYEFMTRRWKRDKDMSETRFFFAAGELDGLVIIAGGHHGSKNGFFFLCWPASVCRRRVFLEEKMH